MIASHLEIWSQTIPAIVLPNENSEVVRLDISNVSDRIAQESAHDYLAVFVKNEGDEYHSNAIQGIYEVAGDYLVFTPYFHFDYGLTYVVRTRSFESDGSYDYHFFQVGEKQAVNEARVISIYPSADELPENLLRLYFYFNTPMKKGQALDHIQLVDTKGKVDNQAFMEFKQELWSADGKRLTLLFDPGRIKRGVSTNMELGPALLMGNKYSLRVSDTWEDVHGQPLSSEFIKEFSIGQAYRRQIRIKDMIVQKPEANSDNGLSIYFDRIMDHALVESMIQIWYENDQRIPGHWKIFNDEKMAKFTPEKKWIQGSYQIIFDNRLEDVAGNNLEALLDQKMGIMNNYTERLVRRFSI